MKLEPGQAVPPISTVSILGKPVSVPDPGAGWVHLQFRRFAGCPVCNFHLHSLARRADEIAAAGIREVVFFHSSAAEMLRYQAQLPFDCVADPGKAYYRRFGVETSLLAPLHPAVLLAGTRNFLRTGRLYTRAENGVLGLPADFLVDPRGLIVSATYGSHAYDNWDADELLRRAHSAAQGGLSPART
jgi:peroxiredoxin